jgi:hypothetical protein
VVVLWLGSAQQLHIGAMHEQWLSRSPAVRTRQLPISDCPGWSQASHAGVALDDPSAGVHGVTSSSPTRNSISRRSLGPGFSGERVSSGDETPAVHGARGAASGRSKSADSEVGV